jgi:hypothetical protein
LKETATQIEKEGKHVDSAVYKELLGSSGSKSPARRSKSYYAAIKKCYSEILVVSPPCIEVVNCLL